METEKETAETVRKRAMESLSETRSRETSKWIKGRETSEYDGFLREKREIEMKVREGEADLERRKVDIEEKKLEVELRLKQKELELRARVEREDPGFQVERK